LVDRNDVLRASPRLNLVLGPDDDLHELRRREAERQGKCLELLTRDLFLLTIVLVLIEVSRLIADFTD
jgi:hypothetical protein